MSNFTDTFPGGLIASRMPDAAAFAKGWAKIPFVGEKPHWYVDVSAVGRTAYPEAPADTRWFESLCGVVAVTNDRLGVMTPGNYPLCKRCLKKAPRWATKEERDTTLPDDVLGVLVGSRVR